MTEAEWLAWTGPAPMLAFLRGTASDRKLRLYGCACCRRIWHLIQDGRSREAVDVAELFADGGANTRELLRARRQADAAEGAARGAEYNAEGKAHFCVTAEYAGAVAALFAARASRAAVFGQAAVLDEGPLTGRRRGRVSRSRDEDTNWWCAASAVAWAARQAVCEAVGFHDPAGFEYPDHPQEWTSAWEGVLPLASEAEEGSERQERAAQVERLRDVVGNPYRAVVGLTSWQTPSVLGVAVSIYEGQRWEDLPILADALEDAGCTDAGLLDHLRGPGPHVRGCWAVDLVLGRE